MNKRIISTSGYRVCDYWLHMTILRLQQASFAFLRNCLYFPDRRTFLALGALRLSWGSNFHTWVHNLSLNFVLVLVLIFRILGQSGIEMATIVIPFGVLNWDLSAWIHFCLPTQSMYIAKQEVRFELDDVVVDDGFEAFFILSHGFRRLDIRFFTFDEKLTLRCRYCFECVCWYCMVKILDVSTWMDCDFRLLTTSEGSWNNDIFYLWRFKICSWIFQVWSSFRVCFISWHIHSGIFLVEVLCISLGLLFWIDIINEPISVV